MKNLFLIAILAAGCNATAPAENESAECDAAYEIAYSDCQADIQATSETVTVVQVDTESALQAEQWRNEALRIGARLELRSAQLEGCIAQVDECTNILYSEFPSERADVLYQQMIEAAQ